MPEVWESYLQQQKGKTNKQKYWVVTITTYIWPPRVTRSHDIIHSELFTEDSQEVEVICPP